MKHSNHRFYSPGWLWVGILALTTGLLLSQGALAAEIEVGKKELGGMNVRVWLDKPMKMQMLMQGMWKTYRPQAGKLTHHLGIDLTDPRSGLAIPTAVIEVTLTHRESGKQMTKKLPAMFGKRFIYGVNLRLDEGKYDLVVKIDPPSIMRMGPSMNKWQTPVEAKFTFVVK